MKTMVDQLPAGSIAALVTPFSADAAEPDRDAWRRLLAWHADAGTAGVVVAGTTGESATLEPAERDELLEIALAEAGDRVQVIAGTGAASTAQAVALSRRAAKLGAAAVLVAAPYYNRPPQRGLLAHFQRIADECPVPVILYNVPARTAVDLEPETVVALADHPNIAGIKEAVADMQRIGAYAGAGLAVFSGDDPSALDAMRHGARGVISVVANVVPESAATMCAKALAGDFTGAASIDARLAPLVRFLSVESNPVPVKWLLASAGRIGGSIRLPLVPLDGRHHDAGRALLESLEAG